MIEVKHVWCFDENTSREMYVRPAGTDVSDVIDVVEEKRRRKRTLHEIFERNVYLRVSKTFVMAMQRENSFWKFKIIERVLVN